MDTFIQNKYFTYSIIAILSCWLCFFFPLNLIYIHLFTRAYLRDDNNNIILNLMDEGKIFTLNCWNYIQKMFKFLNSLKNEHIVPSNSFTESSNIKLEPIYKKESDNSESEIKSEPISEKVLDTEHNSESFNETEFETETAINESQQEFKKINVEELIDLTKSDDELKD